jgi:hypothetical protein
VVGAELQEQSVLDACAQDDGRRACQHRSKSRCMEMQQPQLSDATRRMAQSCRANGRAQQALHRGHHGHTARAAKEDTACLRAWRICVSEQPSRGRLFGPACLPASHACIDSGLLCPVRGEAPARLRTPATPPSRHGVPTSDRQNSSTPVVGLSWTCYDSANYPSFILTLPDRKFALVHVLQTECFPLAVISSLLLVVRHYRLSARVFIAVTRAPD